MKHQFALVAPHFDEARFRGFQRLAGAASSFAALESWHGLLDDLAGSEGLDTSRVDLFGFGGGAQFAHRAALMAPHRVHRLVVASAGWFTWLDPAQSFPHGLSTAPGVPEPDVRAFLALPVLVLAGERDVRRGDRLRCSRRIDRLQGSNRLLRALAWTDHLEEAARDHHVPSRVRFDLLEESRNSFRDTVAGAGLIERVVDFLQPAPSPGLAEVSS
jgi:pimeloyl-ACP methyl ester carboxylesterase